MESEKCLHLIDCDCFILIGDSDPEVRFNKDDVRDAIDYVGTDRKTIWSYLETIVKRAKKNVKAYCRNEFKEEMVGKIRDYNKNDCNDIVERFMKMDVWKCFMHRMLLKYLKDNSDAIYSNLFDEHNERILELAKKEIPWAFPRMMIFTCKKCTVEQDEPYCKYCNITTETYTYRCKQCKGTECEPYCGVCGGGMEMEIVYCIAVKCVRRVPERELSARDL